MPKDKPSSRLRRRLRIAVGLLVAYTVAGFFIAPPVVKSQLQQRTVALLGRDVTVRKVRVNPYALSLTLEGVVIREAGGRGEFLGWERLYVNFDAFRSLLGAWTFGDIELDGFRVSAELRKDGSFNFTDILNRLAAAPAPPDAAASDAPAAPLPRIRIVRLAVDNARADFADTSRKRAFQTTLGPTTFALTEFRTAKDRDAPYRFEAVTESGEKIAWAGTLSAVPAASAGELRLENIALAKYAPYYADLVQADVAGGTLSLQGRYEAGINGDARVMKLFGGAVQLRGLKVLERAGGETAFELPALDVVGIDADAVALKGTAASVTLAGGHLRVRREPDGSINLLTMLEPEGAGSAGIGNAGEGVSPDEAASAAPSGSPAPSASAPAPLPEFRVGEVVLKDFRAEVADLALPRPARLALGNIQLLLKDATLADDAVMPLSLSFDWAPQGTVTLEGTVAIKPAIKADLKAGVTALALLPLSPYLEQFAKARVTQGAVSMSGAVQAALPADGGPPAIALDGSVAVEQLGLVDAARQEELAGFASLALNGLRAATAPSLTVSLAEMNVTSPYVRAVVNQDRSINLLEVAGAGGAAPESETAGGTSRPGAGPSEDKPALPEAPFPKIEIARVTISGGDFSVADHSVEPNVRMAVGRFGGTITGLTSGNLGRGDVDLKATVDGAGAVAITGKLDPFGANPFVDVKIDTSNVDLLPLSPYSGKYAGYELARGKLAVDVRAKLDGRRLDAANVVTLNQFTFGAPVESPDATKLPVRLGVALLKDIDGNIVIDVPVSGSLDDPSFGVGRVVLRVIVNLLTKAAVSPFALLGSMFGGGGDELAWQEFAPGDSKLQADSLKKLETLVKALTNRPGLSLQLEGGYDAAADTPALKRQRFDTFVRHRAWETARIDDPNIAPPDRLNLAPEAYALTVRQLYDEKYPPGTALGAALPAPAAPAAEPAPRKGIFRRIVDAFAGEASPSPSEEATAAPDATATVADGPSLEEMVARLTDTMEITDNDLRALAAARAQVVRGYFLSEGGISADRLFLVQGNEAAKANQGPRVFLTLQ